MEEDEEKKKTVAGILLKPAHDICRLTYYNNSSFT